MIALSRFAPFLATALLVASCSSTKTCNDIGCTSGLTIELDAPVDGGVPTTFQIDLAKLADQQITPLTTCTFTAANYAATVACNPEVSRSPLGTDIVIEQTDIKMLRVTVSANGTVLSQQTVTPTYTSREVWGPGCGYCTQASVRVDLPPP
jgi:hypothetical protein